MTKNKPALKASKKQAIGRHVWVHSQTMELTTQNPLSPDFICFDSWLETNFWLRMPPAMKSRCAVHPLIDLGHCEYKIPWRPDFLFPANQHIIEVKGAWVFEPKFRHELRLLEIFEALAICQGYKVDILVDSIPKKTSLHTVQLIEEFRYVG